MYVVYSGLVLTKADISYGPDLGMMPVVFTVRFPF